MRNQFHYTSHTQEVIFGPHAFAHLGEALDRYHWHRLMVCTSGSSLRNGSVAQIEKALGVHLVTIYDHVQSHVPDFQVAEVLALADENAVDAIIGLGGGSPIGMAKAVSLALNEKRTINPPQATYGGEQSLISIIAIPTTYAGSEMTPVFGITHHKDSTARKITTTDSRVTPKLVLYDPQLTLDLSPELTASTGINALAHCIEAVYSITGNPLSTAAALESARYIARALPRCHAHGDDLEARTEMLAASYLAGTALSSVAMGLHHGICHILGGTLGVPHGLVNAIVLPHVVRYNADVCAQELALVAQAMGTAREERGDAALAMRVADRVSDFVAQMNLPQHLSQVGVRESDLARLAELAAQSRTVQNNPKAIGLTDVAAILRAAF